MKRALLVASCLALLVPAPASAAKKKPKPALGPVTTVAAAGPLASAAGQVSTATATCPGGTKAVGGGFSAPLVIPVSALAVFESYRSGDRTWSVSAVSLIGSGTATAFAYCRKTKGTIADASASSQLASGSLQTASSAATCPSGAKLVSGGFQTTRDGAPTAVAIPTTNMSTAPGTWSLVAVNTSTGAQTIVAHAYCLAGIKQPKVLNATASPFLEPGAAGSVSSPKCPKPKKPKKGKKGKKKPVRRLSGGGFAGPVPPSTQIGAFSDSRITGGTWLATVVHASGPPAGALPITGQAICS